MTRTEVRALLAALRQEGWKHRANVLQLSGWHEMDPSTNEHTWTRGHQTLSVYYDVSETMVDGYLSHWPDGMEHENGLGLHVDYLEELGLVRVVAIMAACGILAPPSRLWDPEWQEETS